MSRLKKNRIRSILSDINIISITISVVTTWKYIFLHLCGVSVKVRMLPFAVK